MSQDTLDMPHLFQFWEISTVSERRALLSEIAQIDRIRLAEQRHLLNMSASPISLTYEPFEGAVPVGNAERRRAGKEALRAGAIACLVLAGGQGTRLGFTGPKGFYPLSIVRSKSLFQLLAEKTAAASRWANRPLFLAIMVSPDQEQVVRRFFDSHDNFGLSSSQFDLCVQQHLPLLDSTGALLLKSRSQLCTGPDGNGHCFHALARAGLLSRWKDAGVKAVHIVPVDNPLADPFDPELAALLLEEEADIACTCSERLDVEEAVGLLVQTPHGCRVIEYTELPHTEREARQADGSLKHRCANLGLFSFSLPFIWRIVQEKRQLPLHRAWKRAEVADHQGNPSHSPHPIAWKFETFLFDWLSHAQHIAVQMAPRNTCFSPLKEKSGRHSPDCVRRHLQQREAHLLSALTGLPSPSFPFELDPSFYYPSPDMQERWKGRTITERYVLP